MGFREIVHHGGNLVEGEDANRRRLIIREVEARMTRAALVQTDEADSGTLFRRHYGMIPSSYLTRMRICQAQYLLISTDDISRSASSPARYGPPGTVFSPPSHLTSSSNGTVDFTSTSGSSVGTERAEQERSRTPFLPKG